MTDRNNKTLGRIFSGAQPTGSMHLGNYLGAIRNWVRLQESYDCIYCVVDLHAITTFQDPKLLADQTREAAATYMAAGVDPEHSILFNQSQVAAHAELAWIFACVARVGWLNRMTQFKDKAGKHREKASIGLYSYPTLMAADIMVYKATHVPAGEDQRQHLELTRDIAQKFNSDFGVEYFPLVEALTLGGGTRVMSLRDGNAKMSKSDPSDYSRLSLSDDRDMIAKKIRKARTDGDSLPGEIAGLKDRPEALNLVTIFASLADRKPDDVLAEFAGRGFADFKAALTDLAIDKLGPITDELNRLKADPGHVDGVLRDGARRAAAIAGPILRQVQEIVGFLRP